MRMTIKLDDDIYAMSRSLAIATKSSISKAVGDLLRRKTAQNARPAPVRRADDKDLVRALHIMGYSDEQIEEMLK